MAQLTSRDLVKQLSNINEVDTRFDTIIDAMIASASDQVEKILERKFTSAVYTEFHQSYDQSFNDRDAQYIWVEAPPIDTGQTITVLWSARNDHDTNGITLIDPDDYEVGQDLDVLIVSRLGSVDNALLPAGSRGVLSYNTRGFKITYTGGFALTGGASSDPADEPNLVTGPLGLQFVVAEKVAADIFRLKAAKRLQMRFGADRHDLRDFAEILLPWTPKQKEALDPYRRKNRIT